MTEKQEHSIARAMLAQTLPFTEWIERRRPPTRLAPAWLAVVERLIEWAQLDSATAQEVRLILQVDVARKLVAALPESTREPWLREASHV